MPEFVVVSESQAASGAAVLLDTRQVASLLGVSISTVKRLVASGALPVVKIGRLVRFRQRDVEGLIDTLVDPIDDGYQGGDVAS